MNGANSYNICPRCGNSNSLSSKYCSRCGGQLKVPEEPLVCHKCHTHNTPMANFCRNCGAQLRVGLETKLCPKCGKEVDAHDSVCACGYSFVTYQQTTPVDPRSLPQQKGAKPSTQKTAMSKQNARSRRRCRTVAILSILFLLLFVYVVMVPSEIFSITPRPSFLTDFDQGITHGAMVNYGGNFVNMVLSMIDNKVITMCVADLIIAALVVVTIVTMLVQLIVCIVRAINGRRAKRLGWFYFAMFLVSVIAVGLIVLFNVINVNSSFFKTVQGWFQLDDGYKPGYVIWGIPLYYLFFFFMSFGARGKRLKESK